MFCFEGAWETPSRQAKWRGVVVTPDQKIAPTGTIDMTDFDCPPEMITMGPSLALGTYTVIFVLDEPSRNPSTLGTCTVTTEGGAVYHFGPSEGLYAPAEQAVFQFVYHPSLCGHS